MGTELLIESMQLKGETVLQLAISCGDSQQPLADINISHYWNIKATSTTTEEHVSITDVQPKIFFYFATSWVKAKSLKVSLTVNCRYLVWFAFHQNQSKHLPCTL